MPPTLVNVSVGILLGVALLGTAFNRRSLSIVALVAMVPDFDVLLSAIVPGVTNALLHAVWIPALAAGALYYDTTVRETSWLATRFGWYDVRIAWVATASYLIAGIGLDLFSSESVALFYPLSNRYYAVIGEFVFTTQEGVIQTYVQLGEGWLGLATPGTTETYRVESWITPGGGERRIKLIETGWQAVIVATAVAAAPAKALVERGDR